MVDKNSTMFESKFLKTVLLAGVIVGGIWLLVNRDRLSEPGDVLTLAKDTISDWTSSGSNQIAPEQALNPYAQANLEGQPDSPTGANTGADLSPSKTPAQLTSHARPVGQVQGVIRVASFKMNPKVTELRSFEPIDLVAEICRQYDVVVLQNLDRNNSTWLKSVTDQMNLKGAVATQGRPALSNGSRADYVSITDRIQRTGEFQTAMIYNRQTIQLDQSRWYVVNDPDEVFSVDPMVAWFRAIGTSPQNAFTFSLASVEIEPSRTDVELLQLGLLIRAIRSDGRGEDDVVLVGDFQADDRGFESIRHQAGLAWVVSRRSTSVQTDRQSDNIVFSEPATAEFTGRGGVVEFQQQYRLQTADALSVSEHLPVWAEFTVDEK